MTTISVVITSYNQKSYLKQAIDSVLAQTWRPIQIVVADDCSQDGSQDLIRSYQSSYPDIVTGIYHSNNLGISENRNSALSLCSGDYVAILDGDDRYLPGNIERQIESLLSDPTHGCCYTNLHIIDETGIPIGTRDDKPQPTGYVFPELAQGKLGWLRSMIIRRDLLSQIGNLDKTFPKHDGFILCLRLATLTHFRYLPEPLAEYRIHPRGDSKSFDRSAKIFYLSDVMNEVYRLSMSQPLSQEQMDKITRAWQFRMLSLSALNSWEKRAFAKTVRLGLLAVLTKVKLMNAPPKSLLDRYSK